MPYAYGYKYGIRVGRLLKPCTDNLIFWLDRYNAEYTELLDKSGEGNDVDVLSNSKYLDGTSTITVYDEGNFVHVIDTVSINQSIDNTIFSEIESSLDSENTLFFKNFDENKIVFGTDGSNNFSGWFGQIALANNYGGEFIRIANSSGIDEEDFNILKSKEQYYVNQAFPFGEIKPGMNINYNMNVTAL